jgi:accessory gene regulator B
MEQLANKVANRIAMELSYPEEQEKVIAYGLVALLQTLVMTILTLLIGALCGIFIEAAVLCFAVSFLRKYSGGAHARSMGSCITIGVMFCIIFGLIIHGVSVFSVPLIAGIIPAFLVYSLALVVAIRKAPVDSPNKPIRTESKKKRMRIGTVLMLVFYMLISSILLIYWDRSTMIVGVFWCLLLSVMWQMGSLTNPGKVFLEQLDRLIYGIITFERRT